VVTGAWLSSTGDVELETSGALLAPFTIVQPARLILQSSSVARHTVKYV
jgi:hypothetical protein